MSGKEERVSVHVRLNPEHYELVAQQAERDGAYSVSAWIRGLAIRAAREGAEVAAMPGYGLEAGR